MGKNLDMSNSYPDEGTHDLIDERSTLVDNCTIENQYLQKLEKQTAEWNTLNLAPQGTGSPLKTREISSAGMAVA